MTIPNKLYIINNILYILCVLDDISDAMVNPMMIPTSKEGVRVGVATTHRTKAGLNEFIEVNKNRVFFSSHTDCELAYEEHASEMKVVREKKQEDHKIKEGRHTIIMTKLMKSVIISYLEKLYTRNIQPLDMDGLMDVMKSPKSVFSSVIHAYFATGVALDIAVNRPKDVFDICVREFIEDILDVVSGKSSLSSEEKRMCEEAGNAFDLE